MKEITQERLKELFNYNPETGHFTWKVKTNRSIKIGSIAGTINGKGYIQIRINKKSYKAHRLAFLYMEGKFPEDGLEVDHINHVKDDNKWVNLRIVTSQDNSKNRTMQSNNKAGYTGVHWHKSHNKYQTQIRVGGKTKYLGLFDNLDDAITARKAAEIKYNFHENHGKQINQLI